LFQETNPLLTPEVRQRRDELIQSLESDDVVVEDPASAKCDICATVGHDETRCPDRPVVTKKTTIVQTRTSVQAAELEFEKCLQELGVSPNTAPAQQVTRNALLKVILVVSLLSHWFQVQIS